MGHVGGLSQGVPQGPEGLAVVALEGQAGLEAPVQAVVLEAQVLPFLGLPPRQGTLLLKDKIQDPPY